jgi:hydroxypyruvate isomerase
MRQSATDWSFLSVEMHAERYYARLAEIGYSAIEMAAPEHWALVRAAGLELLNIAGPGMEWGLNRSDEHVRILPLIRTAIMTAGEAGIPCLIVFSGRRRGQPDVAGIESCVRGLSAVAEEAADASVTLLFELLNTFDHHDYHASSSNFVFEVARRVGAPSVRVLYDAYHAARMGEDLSNDFTANVDLVGHIHVAGVPGRGLPGPGQGIDYGAVVRAALDAGYGGYWRQEFLPGPDPLGELLEAHSLFASYDPQVRR